MALPLLLLASLASAGAAFRDRVDARAFVKIQLHVHTSESDGDSPPEAVAGWYAAHGFAAVALTDHDRLTRVQLPGLTMIPGVEISAHGGKKPVHVNALCGTAALAGARAASPGEALADAVTRAHADGALALVNHPNWADALRGADLLAAPPFELLEIASGHPAVADGGDASHPPAEALWQALLDAGRAVFAVAVDDAHDFARPGEDRKPGRGWVDAWDAQKPCEALRAGRFYATTGVRLRRLRVAAGRLTVDAADFPPGSVVEFLGAGGRLLAESKAVPASYAPKAGDRFVRARLTLPDGRRAWTQAYAAE